MKKVFKIGIFLVFSMLISCSEEYAVHRKERSAEQELDKLESAILTHNLDSVWLITRKSSDIHYIVFYEGKIVYWSNNSLTAPNIYAPRAGGWFDYDFSNARCRCLWRTIGDYEVEVIIPIEWHIKAREEISQSFSYLPMLADKENDDIGLFSSRSKARMFYWLTMFAFVALIILGAVSIARAGGLRNLRLSSRITYTIMFVVLVGFVAVFGVSVQYIRSRYRTLQETELIQKTRYIQSALQSLYFWDYSSATISSSGISVDLRDLAYAYGTDIHVYDLNGRLIGSSTPQLFQHKLLSTYLAPEALFAPENEKAPTFYKDLGDFHYLTAFIEFVNGGYTQLGYIVVPYFISQKEENKEVEVFLARLLPVYLIMLLVGVLLAIALSRALAAPLAAVGERMRTLSLGGKNKHIPYNRKDELGALVAQYNEMVDELERSSRQLARSEREGAWRTMARQIAHEINNPLTPMKLTMQQLQRLKGTERFDEQFDKAVNMLIAEIDNLSRIATSFSTFAKQPEVEPGEVDVAQKLSAVITLTSNNPQGTPIRYFGPDAGVMAYADKEQIGQVFTNIIRNAVQAINAAPDGDIIVILTDDTSSPEVEISISDNGPGIPEDVQPKIFLPNFTTKSTGTGLGLAISKNIIEGADGRITFETSPKGTTFHIYLQRV